MLMEFFEGLFTKVLILDTAYEAETVDSLAATGWILMNINYDPVSKKHIYWFQSKRRIYEKNRTANR